METAFGAFRAACGLTMACVALVGCGDDAPSSDDTGAPDTADVFTRDAGDAVAVDSGTVDVVGGDVNDAGDSGSGLRAHSGGALVGAGGVMTSASFRMVSTLGQSTVHQGTMRSEGFRLQGGLAGATGGRSR